uniref:Uncharacterized protein n=1 Tax=viral metagenome TaxID=1070528 RepID=A0A6C0IEH5_9ZZZZ
MTSIDTNVSSYSISELMAIIDVQEIDPKQIVKNTNKLMDQFKNTNPTLSVFFKEVQSQLLQYSQGLIVNEEDDTDNKIQIEGFDNMAKDAIYPRGEQQVNEWYENENLTQKDTNQVDKITDRKQKIGVFGNVHNPMKREQIATTDTFSLPVKQDSLNPNLKNTITRFVNLDSQFRQYTNGIDSTSAEYTLDLSDTLKDTLSIRIYSYQIPYTWYAIDTAYGNTCLWVIDGDYAVPVSVPAGNYTSTNFQTALGNAFSTAGFDPSINIVEFNSNSGIIKLNLFNVKYNENGVTIFTVTTTTTIMFYDFTGVLQCNNNCYSKSNHDFNNTLGWIMGYRVPYVTVDASGNSAPAILDLNGPKYLILVIDDYNQNHINNSLVSISQFNNTLKMPNYYSPDLPYTCITPAQKGNNLKELIQEATITSLGETQNSTTLNGLLIAGKYQQEYSTTQIVLPSAPRTLTQAQLYTINQINSNRNNLTQYLSKAPTTADILGILPIKTAGVTTGTLLVELGGSLQDNIRTYFGPVDIDRMSVKLLDDKGNVLNLNGNDWCVTIICECLYQY